jgi:uncharacterized protein
MTGRDILRKAAAERIIRCPSCGGDSVYATTNPHRPFCSARCRGADLGAWASENYRVAAEPPARGEGLDLPTDAED